MAAQKPSKSKTARPRRPAVSPEDQAMFLDAIAGATPLGGRDRVHRPQVKEAVVKVDPLPPRIALTIEGSGDHVVARAPGVNRAQVAELRSGRVRPEETLDLHGDTVAVALPRLERFLRDASRARRRCVLIVHGKGLHSDGVAVLRDAVIGALAGELSGLVHAFTAAAAALGGGGATAVMVRA